MAIRCNSLQVTYKSIAKPSPCAQMNGVPYFPVELLNPLIATFNYLVDGSRAHIGFVRELQAKRHRRVQKVFKDGDFNEF